MKSLNDISFDVRGAAFEAYNELGPGLFESVYETVMQYLLMEKGCTVKSQVSVPVIFRDIKMDIGFRLDLLVDDAVIVEIKSVESLHDVHHKQLLTYLKLTNKKLGLLINFNTSNLSSQIIRIVNNF